MKLRESYRVTAVRLVEFHNGQVRPPAEGK